MVFQVFTPKVTNPLNVSRLAQQILETGLAAPIERMGAEQNINASKQQVEASKQQIASQRLQDLLAPQEFDLKRRELEANIKNQEASRQLQASGLGLQAQRLNLAQNQFNYKATKDALRQNLTQRLAGMLLGGGEAPKPDASFVGAMPESKGITPTEAATYAMAAGEPSVAKTFISMARANTPLVQIDERRESERTKGEEKTRRVYIDDAIDATSKVINTALDVDAIDQQLKQIASKPGAASTGALAPAISFVNSVALQAGVPQTQLLSSGSDLENIEAFSNKLVTPLAKQLGVNPTDFDFKNLKATVASAGKTMQSNFALIDVQKQAIRRANELQSLINQAEEGGLGLVGVRKLVNNFNNQQHIFVPKALPPIQNLKIGERYLRDDGVFIWNGQKFMEAEY